MNLMTRFEEEGKYIDLHTHSTASDGSMEPAALVRHAHRSGLDAIALTDHDTLNGVGQALEEGARLGTEVIPGVEISVSLSSWDLTSFICQRGQSGTARTGPSEPEMHLLGYFFSGGYELLAGTLEELRQKREQRNPKIIAKLNELGFDITIEEVNRTAAGGNAGRPHIARVLMEKGYVSSISEGFDKYLAAGRPAYFSKDKLTPEEGLAEIIRAGGVPVLAHPISLGVGTDQLGNVLEKLKKAGLKGIEAIYTENTQEQTEELLKLAGEYGLKVTGGSDFHGSYKPDIEIGTGRGNLRIPYSLLSALKEA
jgi:predicted metal-dependent phosphoesterase TrpH